MKMAPDLIEIDIDEIVSTCNGDLRGAVKALLLVNEQLETELQQLYAASVRGGAIRPGTGAVH
jgi:hypothetical protein